MAFSKSTRAVQKPSAKGAQNGKSTRLFFWLTGMTKVSSTHRQREVDMELFPTAQINPNAKKITGVICSVRVEQIEDPLMQKIRWLDKLWTKLAKANRWRKF